MRRGEQKRGREGILEFESDVSKIVDGKHHSHRVVHHVE